MAATVAVGASVLALGACVGSVARDDFDDEVRSRGGGLDGELVLDAVEAIEADLGEDGIQVRSVEVTAGQVTMQVQVPDDPEELDTYRYGSSGLHGGRGLSDPQPVSRGAGEPALDAQLFAPDAAGLDRLGAMVDAALDAADLRRAYASGASVRRAPTGAPAPVTSITVTNERHTVVVTFAADGTLLERVDR